MTRFNCRCIVQKAEEIEGDLRDTKNWVDQKLLKARKTTLNPRGQAEYQQLRNSDFTIILEFRGHHEFSMANNRFRLVNGKTYEPIEPPKYLGDMTQRTKIAVQEIEV